MARPGRPASEGYQSRCCSVSQSVSYSSATGIEGTEEDSDRTPIFSLSKSSMDVVMATGPPHKRDPAWTGMDLRRSSSASAHCDQNSLQELRPHSWQQVCSLQSSPAGLNSGARSPSALSERWIANMQRWSRCSGGSVSRSSTPDTVVWKGGSSRPCSLTQEVLCSSVPDSPLSRVASPPTTPSPFISPLMTPTLPPVDLLSSSPLPRAGSAAASPSPSPRQVHASSPLAPSSPTNLIRLTNPEDEGFLENNLLSFHYPSPIPSSVSLAEAATADAEAVVDGAAEVPPGPDGEAEAPPGPDGMQASEGDAESSEQLLDYMSSSAASEGPTSNRGASVCHLELPWQPGQREAPGQGRRSPLVTSLSDSRLRECCRCNVGARGGIRNTEEGTMTSRPELVDAAVQTVSPVGSWWDLKRNTSNMGSHSILGSPPGSRLNLKSSMGSHSNLVSPSSSMFPVGSDEEEERRGDDARWDANSASSHDLDKRRSCLKTQLEEKDELGRRSSMKQVQWDEDGMTWDVHGASVDPEELSSAIQKHLELRSSPQPTKCSSKKKRAPKPPLISTVVKALTPETSPPAATVTPAPAEEGETGEGAPEADGAGGVGGAAEPEEEEEAKAEEAKAEEAKAEEPAGSPRRVSRAEAEKTKEEDEEEVYGEEGAGQPKSPSRGSGKRSVMRSLRRPGWCGGSRKADD